MIDEIKELINDCDAIVIGAGAGLSTAAGVKYGSEGFSENFPELVKHYGFTDFYTSSFYEFATEEERWSYWAKHIHYLCIGMDATATYKKLFELVRNKNYYVITTNVDRQFIKSGFDVDRVFEVQGSLTKIQCSCACHNKLYDDTDMVLEMLEKNKDVKVPTELVPYCPVCGEKMELNLRKDNFFVEDDYWHEHFNSFENFINEFSNKKIVFLELGAGFNTPGIIRYPFEEYTYKMKDAYLIRINDKYYNVPNDISNKSIGIGDDINKVIDKLLD